MRFLLKKLAFAAVVLATTSMLPAQQVRSIVSGRTAMQLNTNFVQSMEALGANFTDLGLATLRNGSITFPIVAGSVDLNTVAGELQHKGGLVIQADEQTIELLDWKLDITGSQPTISVLFVVNGSITGRFPLFLVQPPVDLALPLQPQGGVILIKQASLFLSQAGASTFNNLFGLSGDQQLQAYAPVGNIDVYAVLAANGIGTK